MTSAPRALQSAYAPSEYLNSDHTPDEPFRSEFSGSRRDLSVSEHVPVSSEKMVLNGVVGIAVKKLVTGLITQAKVTSED